MNLSGSCYKLSIMYCSFLSEDLFTYCGWTGFNSESCFKLARESKSKFQLLMFVWVKNKIGIMSTIFTLFLHFPARFSHFSLLSFNNFHAFHLSKLISSTISSQLFILINNLMINFFYEQSYIGPRKSGYFCKNSPNHRICNTVPHIPKQYIKNVSPWFMGDLFENLFNDLRDYIAISVIWWTFKEISISRGSNF